MLSRSTWIKIGVFILLLAAFIIPRIGGLGSFVTADEPTWGKRSAIFYYALMNGEYDATNLTGHPGVTTMWLGAAAYGIQFPRFEKIGQLNFGDSWLLINFIRHQINPMTILATARSLVALVVITAMMAAFLFAVRLLGIRLAFFGFLLIAFDPFHVAHSRYLHTNGMLGTFMFLSVVAFLYYLHTRRAAGLIVSGAAAGLSFLSITPGFFLIPIIGLLTLAAMFIEKGEEKLWSPQVIWKKGVLPLLAWGIVSLAVITIAWPAMWSNPIDTLASIIQYAFSAAEGEIGGAHFVEAYENMQDQGALYLHYYPLVFLWRTTPLVLAGIFLAILFARRLRVFPKVVRWSLLGLAAYAVLYALFMTAGAKKFDRYLLPAFPAMDVLAAAGWVMALTWFRERFQPHQLVLRTVIPTVILVGVVAFQAVGTLQKYPYYLTYYNPLMGGPKKAPEVVTVGWGEGLNQAARYLDKVPGIRDKKILSWYALAFSWYGLGMGVQAEDMGFSTRMPLDDYLQLDYIVLYVNQWQRNTPPHLLEYLGQQEPEHTVTIGDVEYVRIYRIDKSGE
jgi:hypothetical protein